MLGKGKTTLAADLDIFGADEAEDTVTPTQEIDLFGASDETDTDTQDTTDTTDTSTDTTDEKAELDATADEATDKTESAEDEQAPADGEVQEKIDEDPELKKLFEDIDREIAGDTKLQGLIQDLKVQNADLVTQLAVKDKQIETLNEKLISNAGSEADLGIYRPVITNLEENPRLMLLAKYMGKQWDNDKIKTRLVSVLSDFIEELTGQNVSDLIDSDQSSKILSTTKEEKTSIPNMKNDKEDDEEWNKEDSLTRLF